MEFEIGNHIAIQVRDYEKALTFYKNVMGMQILEKDDNEAEVKCGSTLFHVENSERGKPSLISKSRTSKRPKGNWRLTVVN